MNIQAIKYGNEEGTVLDITLTDDSHMFFPWPSDNAGADKIQTWLDAGNSIAPMYDAAQLDAMRVAAIKAEAGRRIVEIMPEWKQRNLLARMVELLNKETLTIEEQAEADSAQALWDSVKSIRQTSDDAEINGTDPDDIVW